MKDSEQPRENSFPLTKNAGRIENPTAVSGAKRAGTQTNSVWYYVRITTALVCCIGAMAMGTVVGTLYWGNIFAQKMLGGFFTNPLNALANWVPEKQFVPEQQHTLNVLLLGCDYNYDERKPVPIKGQRGRSDAILIAQVNFDDKTIHVMSVPRDTAVRIPKHRIQKINAAHAIGGPELTQQVIKDVFGISTDYYMTVNFDGFRQLVDKVGGVDLTVEKRLKYTDNWANLHIDLQPGFQHLDGYNAMCYVRMRHSDSDLIRAQRQQNFLEALRGRVKDPRNLLNVANGLNVFMQNIETNMNHDQMLTLANFARQVPRENIQVATLPVIEGPSYVYADSTKGEALIRKLFFHDDRFIQVSVNAVSRREHGREYRDYRRTADGRRSWRRNRNREAAITEPTPNPDEPITVMQDPEAPSPDNGGEGTAQPEDKGSKPAVPDGDKKPGPEPEKKPGETGKDGGDTKPKTDGETGTDRGHTT